MFQMQSPIKAGKNGVILLTQLFGANDVDFYQKLGLLGHNGIDFKTTQFLFGHAPVVAAHDGYVISDKSNMKQTSGVFVKLLSDEVEIAGRKCKVQTIYYHLKTARVSITDNLSSPQVREMYWSRKGERFVKAGQLIGTADNSGQYTTGPHLHFGMYIAWKKSNGTYDFDWANGYDGAVNPMPYLLGNQLFQISTGLFSSQFFYNSKIISRKEASKYMTPPPWF